MDHAILVAAGTGIDGERLNSHGETIVGGTAQIKRLIITAQRAGIKEFTIIVEKDSSRLKDILRSEKRIKSNLTWHPLGSAIKFEPEPSLILQSNLIISPTGLSNLTTCKVSQDEIAVLVDEDKSAWVKTKGNLVEDISLSGGKAVGAFVAYGSLLEKSILNSMSLKSWTLELIGRERVKSLRFCDGYWMRLSTDEKSVKEAEKLLFSHIKKSSDGWISKNINRKMSIAISRFLIRSPLTPNIISVIIGIIGMLSGVFYALGYPVWGAISLELNSILDGCDGEIARMKLMESKRGQWIDTIFDHLSYMSFVVGVPIGFYKLTKSLLALILGTVNIGIFIFFVWWSFYFIARYTNSGSMIAYSKTVDKLFPVENRTILHKFIVKLRPMFSHQFFPIVFLIAAIFGGYPWVISLTTLGLSLALIHQVDDLIKLRSASNPTS
jgi:CDP-L-myo-inositol myo-inositolphosphotransferase